MKIIQEKFVMKLFLSFYRIKFSKTIIKWYANTIMDNNALLMTIFIIQMDHFINNAQN